ncbi:hypothetical protein [uncultured Microbacterium sp.]
MDEIISNALLTLDDLAAVGTKWPVVADDRKPRYPIEGGLLDGLTEGLGD